ncbi:MAG: cupin domain-containing protein [Bryobacteraceae bacterium]
MKWSREEAQEIAALYAAGALTPEDCRKVESALAEGKFPAADELSANQEAIAQVAYTLPQAQPRGPVKDRLFKRIRPVVDPGFTVTRRDEAEWQATPFPGIDYRRLFVDPKTRLATTLLRLAPGAKYPAHHHTDYEQCYVMKGEVQLGKFFMHAGDFVFAVPESDHYTVESATGCVLLIVSSLNDKLL